MIVCKIEYNFLTFVGQDTLESFRKLEEAKYKLNHPFKFRKEAPEIFVSENELPTE